MKSMTNRSALIRGALTGLILSLATGAGGCLYAPEDPGPGPTHADPDPEPKSPPPGVAYSCTVERLCGGDPDSSYTRSFTVSHAPGDELGLEAELAAFAEAWPCGGALAVRVDCTEARH